MVEGFFDAGIIEQGVVHDFNLAGDILYYFIVPPSVSISGCEVALWHPAVHESTPFGDKCCQWL